MICTFCADCGSYRNFRKVNEVFRTFFGGLDMVLPDTRLQKNHADKVFGRDRKMLFRIQTGKFSRNEKRKKWKDKVVGRLSSI